MLRRIITLLLVLVPCFWWASPALAMEVGIGEPFGGEYSTGKEWEALVGMNRTKELGATWHREWIFWNQWQKTRGAPLDSSTTRMLDVIASLAQDRGIQVYGLVYAAPQWANGSSIPEKIPGGGDPNDPAFQQFVIDYGDFIYQIVSAYRGRIDHWEIWNEPDLDVFWKTELPTTPQQKARGYAYLLKHTYLRAKQANPGSVIIIGGATAWGSDSFIRELYNQGAGAYFDRANIHPYTENPQARPADSPLFARIGSMRQIMDANGDAGKPVWVTEFGYTTTGASSRTVSDQEKIDYMINALETVRTRYPSVEMFSFFRLMDRRWYDSDDFEAGFGVLYTDVYRDGVRTGRALYEPKEVFYALKGYLALLAVPPNLELQAGETYWASYGDYLARSLSVDFNVKNTGSTTARSAAVQEWLVSNRVAIARGLPVYLGDVASGQTVPFTAGFRIPPGVVRFRLYLRGEAYTELGQAFSFPSGS